MSATQHFYRGPLSIMTQQKKRDSEKHTELFLEFLSVLEGNKLMREKQKEEKLFTRESSQQAKEEMGNLFGFCF